MGDRLLDPNELSRRDFVRFSGVSLLATGIPWLRGRSASGLAKAELGRVIEPTADIFSRPSFGSSKIKTFWQDDVFELGEPAVGDQYPEHNRIWYQVRDLGFVHSSAIQPVRQVENTPVLYVPYAGLLTEVTVPFVDVYWEADRSADHAYRFYYGSTHWINGVSRDRHGDLWYRVYDDRYTHRYYGRAEAFRLVPVSELTTIGSHVPADEKRIEVDLAQQWLFCYEADQLVFSTKISSGRFLEDGTSWTPTGKFITFRKRPSRHMAAGNMASGYDLPGVPWVSYITDYGVAFHGTYWHNDFGAARSHGCVNLANDSAKWLYRWTHPVVPHTEMEAWVDYGTPAEILL